MSILETTDLKKYYGIKPNITKALDGVSLSVEQGEFVAIVGTSGSGKSTLLNMMGGLDVPTSGSVRIKGKELSRMNKEQLTIFRRRNIGFVFQNYNLVSKPAILLADEPTGNLDSRTSGDVLGLLKMTSRKFDQTIVMITHNAEIAQLAERTIRIEDGRIHVQGGVCHE